MTIQLMTLLSAYIQQYPNLVVIMGYYTRDECKYRNFVYFRVSIGVVYSQYPAGY